MKRMLMVVAAMAAMMSGAAGQAGGPTGPGTFISTTTYHVDEEHRLEYEKWLKTRYRQYAEALIQEDPAVLAVASTRVIYGGVVDPEANFFTTIRRDGWPKPAGSLQDGITQRLFGKSYQEFLEEARPLRKRLGQTLSRVAASAGVGGLEEGDLTRIDFKKVTPGKMSDYVQLERGYEPLRSAQVKAGSMTSWAMNTVVLPGGLERPYDAYTVHTGKSLEQVMTWGRDTQSIAAKMSQAFDLTGPNARALELQKIVRSEVRVAVLVVKRK